METFPEEPQQITLQDENIDYWTFIQKESVKSIEEIETILQDLGLSKNEIQVYLYLALYNERKASEISKALHLHRTNTYQILRDLEKKGIVSSRLEKPLKFVATPFEKAIDTLIEAKKLNLQTLERKKKNLVNVWLSLPKPKIESSQKEIFQILEGEEQVTLKMAEAIQNAQNEIALFISENDMVPFYNAGLLEPLQKNSSLDVKLLTDNSPKARFFVEKLRLQNKRYASTEINSIPTFALIDRSCLIFLIKCFAEKSGKRAAQPGISALWTNYEAFIKALSALFTQLWNGGNKT
ncbi:MAG: hypothetical protein NWF09_06350 [Candidatus Bathyarchaeota archaeon]|nr:hypothetical protein [Candidatus Bathyarchaeota archaeon]